MFNDKYCLTQAVLDGAKTMTRRILHGTLFWERCPEGMWTDDEIKAWKKEVDQRLIDYSMTDEWPQMKIFAMKHCRYKVGEVVAIAQSYKSIADERDEAEAVLDLYKIGDNLLTMDEMGAGWNNKMFVKANLMPHHIRITDVKIERLQDISDKECLREGVKRASIGFYAEGVKVKDWEKEAHRETASGCLKLFPFPRQAFASLIDKVSGKGTWESNPWVVAYSFELVD